MSKAEFLVFVDGYNLIHAWAPLAARLEEDLDLARAELMEILAEYKSLTGNRVVLVFDAHKVKGRTQHEENYKGIKVVYTKSLETADLYIERKLLDRPPRYRVMVVSNDSMIQQIILGRGGMRMTVQEFMTTLEDQKRTIRRRKKREITVQNTNLVSIEELLNEQESRFEADESS